jgi:hypothetical protein
MAKLGSMPAVGVVCQSQADADRQRNRSGRVLAIAANVHNEPTPAAKSTHAASGGDRRTFKMQMAGVRNLLTWYVSKQPDLPRRQLRFSPNCILNVLRAPQERLRPMPSSGLHPAHQKKKPEYMHRLVVGHVLKLPQSTPSCCCCCHKEGRCSQRACALAAQPTTAYCAYNNLVPTMLCAAVRTCSRGSLWPPPPRMSCIIWLYSS